MTSALQDDDIAALGARAHRAQALPIAVVTGPASLANNVARIGGFMDELKANAIDTGKMWVAESDFSPMTK